MRYEGDPEKDVLNKRKHGLNLADGIPTLEDPDRHVSIDDRFDYGEVRLVTAGRSDGKVLFIVSAEAGKNAEGEEITRIISVRKAKWYEEDWFYFGRT